MSSTMMRRWVSDVSNKLGIRIKEFGFAIDKEGQARVLRVRSLEVEGIIGCNIKSGTNAVTTHEIYATFFLLDPCPRTTQFHLGVLLPTHLFCLTPRVNLYMNLNICHELRGRSCHQIIVHQKTFLHLIWSGTEKVRESTVASTRLHEGCRRLGAGLRSHSCIDEVCSRKISSPQVSSY